MKMKMMEPNHNDKYLIAHGICPNCDKHGKVGDIECSEITVDSGFVYRKVWCQECGATWCEWYAADHITDLHVPEPEPRTPADIVKEFNDTVRALRDNTSDHAGLSADEADKLIELFAEFGASVVTDIIEKDDDEPQYPLPGSWPVMGGKVSEVGAVEPRPWWTVPGNLTPGPTCSATWTEADALASDDSKVTAPKGTSFTYRDDGSTVK